MCYITRIEALLNKKLGKRITAYLGRSDDWRAQRLKKLETEAGIPQSCHWRDEIVLWLWTPTRAISTYICTHAISTVKREKLLGRVPYLLTTARTYDSTKPKYLMIFSRIYAWTTSWLHVANNVCTTVWNSILYTRKSAPIKPQQKSQLFSPPWLLGFLVIGTLRPLSKTPDENQFKVVTTDKYSKITRAISTGKAMPTWIAMLFFDQRVMPLRMVLYLLGNNDPVRWEALYYFLHLPLSGKADKDHALPLA